MVVAVQSCMAPAGAEFRFSSQRSLLAPDPFLKKRKARPIEPERLAAGVASLRAPSHPYHRLNGLDPALTALIGKIEIHFKGKAQIVSGCRSPEHNRRVGGALHSFHLNCQAADILIGEVSPSEIRDYVMSLPERGGVGTYCSTPIVHVDIGPKRQWHWGCGQLVVGYSPFDLQ
jgi:uncharacterized protein YcbK (DUF882 family)